MSFGTCSALALPTVDRGDLESAAGVLGKEQRRPFFERNVMRYFVLRSTIPSPHSEQADVNQADRSPMPPANQVLGKGTGIWHCPAQQPRGQLTRQSAPRAGDIVWQASLVLACSSVLVISRRPGDAR
jgi:hypothetical protein